TAYSTRLQATTSIYALSLHDALPICRWTVEAAIQHAVPAPAIAASLFARFSSRQDNSPSMKAVAAMRNQFGGHALRTDAPPTTRSEEHTSELQSREKLVCRLLLKKKK